MMGALCVQHQCIYNMLTAATFCTIDNPILMIKVQELRYLFVVINRNGDGSSSNRFILRVVKVRYIGVLQRLLSSESLLRIELQQLLHQVQCILWCIWEHVTQLVGVGVGLHHGLHHGLGILGVHSFNVVGRRHSCKDHTENLTAAVMSQAL